MDDNTMHGTQRILFKAALILPFMLALTSCSTTGNMQNMRGMQPSSTMQHKQHVYHHSAHQLKHTVKHTKQAVVTHKSTAQHTTAPVVSAPKQIVKPAISKAMTAKPVAAKPVTTKPAEIKPVAIKPAIVKPAKTSIKPITVKVITTKPAATTPSVISKIPNAVLDKLKSVAAVVAPHKDVAVITPNKVVTPTEAKHSVLLTAKSVDLNPRNYNNLGKTHDIVASLRYQDFMNGRYHTIQVVRWDGISANETVVNARTAILEAIAGLTMLENGVIHSGFGPVVVILGGNAYLMNIPGDRYDFIMIHTNKKFPQKRVKSSAKHSAQHPVQQVKLTHALNKYKLLTDFYITNVNGVIGIRVAGQTI